MRSACGRSSRPSSREAESAEAGGDHILGVRLLFRACLAQLEEARGADLSARGDQPRASGPLSANSPLRFAGPIRVGNRFRNGTAREPAWPPTLSPVTTRTNGSARWPPHPPRARMLNTRNVVAAAVLITLVSLVGACLAMFEPPGGGGLGTDSYGTRGHGYKALYEMLAALDVPVERANLPPDRLLSRETTFAFLEPSPEIVSTEPAYLHAVSRWVKAGGTVVVSPSPRQRQFFNRKDADKNVLAELGLDGLRVEVVRPRGHRGSAGGSYRSRCSLRADTKRAAENFLRLFGRQPAPPTSTVHATAEGSLAKLFPHGLDLVLFDQGRRDRFRLGIARRARGKKDDKVRSVALKPRHGPAGLLRTDHPRKGVAPAQNGGPVVQGRIRAVLEPGGQPETLGRPLHAGQRDDRRAGRREACAEPSRGGEGQFRPGEPFAGRLSKTGRLRRVLSRPDGARGTRCGCFRGFPTTSWPLRFWRRPCWRAGMRPAFWVLRFLRVPPRGELCRNTSKRWPGFSIDRASRSLSY